MNATAAAGRVLMCSPEFFQVDYVINPWMAGNVRRTSPQKAAQQWHRLHDLIAQYAEVVAINPQQGCPDMVFTANAGLTIGNLAVPSHFLHKERCFEEPHFKRWFTEHGFQVQELPENLPFEGAGDALLDRAAPWLWAAYGFRSELQAHPYLARIFVVEVLSLRLIDPRFYHLDTCFCPLANGFLLYYPPAFDASSISLIESRVPAEKRLVCSEADALDFACNAINLDNLVILNRASNELKTSLNAAGFEVLETPLSEFMLAGGAAKCLTLRLDETMASPAPSIERLTLSGNAIESCVVGFAGHLLDSGTLSRALDTVINGGGSFQILDFALGQQRHSPSTARVQVTAPSNPVLQTITAQLINLGGRLKSPHESAPAAKLAAVTQDGVAPDDFYVTTIYPTEVRLDSSWIRAEQQRMDAVITIENAAGAPRAYCKLLRDLKVGEQVVVGVEGIRTRHGEQAGRQVNKESAADEFSFMGAGISSERRVELAVENIAWELHRLRAQGGKTAIVAGPVVIHTGGGPHLARLIRGGYVGALLAGNALAVHDLEQSMFGTSLGVDLGRGTPVRGGHRHHLRVINRIRGCGGIRQAVEDGVVTGGIFYECVQRGVPFALAGSIRDDGPLPDTQMDLIQAQADYARLLADSQMTLLLSTMLHAIGAGNMTPSGVKLVCVDINPAVVTKLSDRGSMESVGIVTDVGLFLSLLVRQLDKLEGREATT